MTMAIVTAERGDEPHQSRAASLTASATQYESWGWMVVRAGDRLLLVPNEHISSVELPAALAAEVQHYLAVRLLAGPVIALPGTPSRWLLLTESADDAAPVNDVRLRNRGGQVHRSGALVPLPPSRLESGQVVWRVPPSLDGPKPPFHAVVAGVRTATETAGLAVGRA